MLENKALYEDFLYLEGHLPNYSQVTLITRICQCTDIKWKGKQPIQVVDHLQSSRPNGGPPLKNRLHHASLLLV
jgi:hypothetical protein